MLYEVITVPVCTRGGLKARGHPVGATGMYQVMEVVQQLRGECAETQVEGAKIGDRRGRGIGFRTPSGP